MKKRRVLSLFSILLVSLLFSPYTFSQETPGPVVRVAPRPLLSDNDPHRVDIVIENGQAVTGYQVMLQYDHDYIEYVDIDHGNYLPDDAFFGDAQIRDTDPNDSFKAILFAAAAFPNQSEGDGVLATLTFKTIIAESSDLTLLDVTLLSHDVVDNTVAVSSPQLENSRTYVVEPPDLVVQSFGASLTGDKSDSLTEITLYPNGEFYLHVGIKNDETETSDQTRVLYYQSDDDTISGDDTLILGGKKVSLSGNSVRARYLKRQAPDISGTYFYYACVESVPHETKTGNNCSSNVVKITVSSICTFPETVAGDERKVGRVAYSPDGTVLAAGDRDDNFHFHFWNASTGEHLHTGEAKGRIYGMAFSPGGKWFAIGTDGGELWLWERNQSTDSTWLEMLQDNSSLPSAPTITVPRPGLIGAGNLNDITSVAFSHDGNRLAIGTGRDDVFVSEYNAGTWDDWDDNTVLVPKQESIVRSVAFHPTDSNIFVSGYEDGRVRIWDLSGGLSNYKNNGPDPQVLSGDAPVYSIAFSPNGDYLATAGMFKKPSGSGHPSGGSINTWHKIALWKRQNNQWVNHTYFFTDDQHDTDVLSVAFHPSGNVLLSGDKNGNIHAWGVRLGNHLGRINDYNFSNSNISSIAFNSQGNAGAVGMDRGEVHQFTFDVSNQTLTQANVTINDRPKVHVIWYHASNEKLRGTSRSFALPDYPDYIQPNNVEQNLKDVQDFFLRELGTTFEFELDNNGIKVEYIQSRNFFALRRQRRLRGQPQQFIYP